MSEARGGHRPEAPEVVLFDLGGVVVDVDLDRSRRRWADVTRLDGARFDATFFESGLKARMERHPIDPEGLERLVNKSAGLGLRGEEIQAIWNACLLPRADVIRLIERVADGTRVGVLSDTDPCHAAFIRALPGLDEAVEHWTFSYEVGRLKPDAAMFEMALCRFGVAPSDAVLVDDKLRNIDGARALGIDGVLFTTFEAVEGALVERGVLAR